MNSTTKSWGMKRGQEIIDSLLHPEEPEIQEFPGDGEFVQIQFPEEVIGDRLHISEVHPWEGATGTFWKGDGSQIPTHQIERSFQACLNRRM